MLPGSDTDCWSMQSSRQWNYIRHNRSAADAASAVSCFAIISINAKFAESPISSVSCSILNVSVEFRRKSMGSQISLGNL